MPCSHDRSAPGSRRVASGGTSARGAPRVDETRGAGIRTIELRVRRQSWRPAEHRAAAGAWSRFRS